MNDSVMGLYPLVITVPLLINSIITIFFTKGKTSMIFGDSRLSIKLLGFLLFSLSAVESVIFMGYLPVFSNFLIHMIQGF